MKKRSLAGKKERDCEHQGDEKEEGGREIFTVSMDGRKSRGDGEGRKGEKTQNKFQKVCTEKGFGICLNFSA